MIPWQARKEIGLVKALLETIKEVLSGPRKFFDTLDPGDSAGEPLLFCVICSTLAGAVALIVKVVTEAALNIKSSDALPLYMYAVVIIIMPLLIVLALYSSAFFMHLGVLLFKGKGGFKGTLDVLAYNSATSIFNIVPFIGGAISMVWSLVVGIIGFKRIHNLSTPRAIFAYCLVPLIAVSILVLLVAISLPQLLRVRLEANEVAAQATLRTISTAVEAYSAQHQGLYPKDEYDLRFATPPYLNAPYDGKTISGYSYSLNLSPGGYQVVAHPASCGDTGNQVFIIKTKGVTLKEKCKK